VPDEPDPHLTFVGHTLIHMDRSTYAWVDIKKFEVDDPSNFEAVLRALIAHDQYTDTYAGNGPQPGGNIHGKYVLSDIGVEAFEPIPAADAVATISVWSDRVRDRHVPPVASAGVRQRLEVKVYPLLAAGQVWRFTGATEHEWGFVVGSSEGFHEFVSIDAQSRHVSLIVASDD